jgi:hypothetical protein
MSTLFLLGKIVATPEALERARACEIELLDLLSRHAHGDWGDLDAHDKRANQAALKSGARIFSAYGEGDAKLWIITDAAYSPENPRERQVTTILRPEDY